eukprot:7185591-Heterocapsa_arctica.AAC.1
MLTPGGPRRPSAARSACPGCASACPRRPRRTSPRYSRSRSARRPPPRCGPRPRSSRRAEG